MNRLEPILAATRAEVQRRREVVPLGALERAAARRRETDPPRPFKAALAAPGLAVIAEHKRRSPSAGTIRAGSTIEDVVSSYARGGASALSVLTDEPHFDGSLDDLAAARAATSLPILRKDFIVDRYQIAESLAAGADAVLLIVAALSPRELRELHEQAGDADLAALVEVHDRAELERAIAIDAELIGINNRDLATLVVDTGTTFALLPLLPDGVVSVAESGFSTPAELRELRAAGADAVLIGEALMRAPDPGAAAARLVRAVATAGI